MRQIADWALGMAVMRGAGHAEARIVHERGRSLGTRNGRVAVASEVESLGLGVRVLAEGGWGFAATQELTQAGVERCAALAVEIARVSARVRREPVQLVAEPAAGGEGGAAPLWGGRLRGLRRGCVASRYNWWRSRRRWRSGIRRVGSTRLRCR